MRISKEEMEAAKRGQDLRAVIESYGGKLKKKGANYVGLCPFHEEKTPSFTVNPKTNLWHCFGCNAGGDVIGFVCKKEGIGFREAMEKLRIQKPGVREALKEIGILNSKGHEMFYGCVVFPVFDENQDCVGLYGRRIAEGEVNHLYLPGPRRGVFNYQAVKRSKSVILRNGPAFFIS
jgi:DNA primase